MPLPHVRGLLLASLALLATASACQRSGRGDPVSVIRASASPARLAPFGDAAALRHYSDAFRELERRQEVRRRESMTNSAASPPALTQPAPTSATAREGASITNNQEAGVDEGDIVKAHGDHLVILRRGRLFTVRVGDGAPTPVSMIDAFAPGSTPASWYDEMLVEGDTVAVLGYGYNTGGTEVNLFDLDPAGHLTYRETLFVRSGDYYSARNYATRIVGRKLVMYLPVPLRTYGADGALNLPAVRHARGDDWRAVIDYEHLYRPLQSPGMYPLIHTVLFCDLATRPLACRAEGVVGPYSRTFYVSGRAVYVWVTGPRDARDADPDPSSHTPSDRAPQGAVLYRFPLNGDDPSALGVRGGPVDQFSFRETRDELQVLVRADSAGDGMWGPEVAQGDAALLRAPLARFGAEVQDVPASAYRALPSAGDEYMFQNRFVGDHLLYGTGSTWVRAGDRVERPVFVHAVSTGDTTHIALPHGIDRIEPMGRDAVVIGSDGADLHFTALALDARPTIADTHVRPGAAQGETRSHGFFFNPTGERAGVLGLPLRAGSQPGYAQLTEGSAEVTFLRVDGLHFTPLGALRATPMNAPPQDGCRASCVDWYGNARPIFYRGRVLALMGYELVAGDLRDNAITEAGRVDYFRAPRAP